LFARRQTAVAGLTALLVLGVGSIASAGQNSQTVSAHGIRLAIPSSWSRVRPAGDGPVVDPKTLLVVGTHGVTARASNCQIAAYRIPPLGAVVVVVGWTSLKYSGASGAKQGRFPLSRLIRVRRPSFECFSGRGAVADLVLDGKAYQVNVMVGSCASARVVEQALAVGRSFELAR